MVQVATSALFDGTDGIAEVGLEVGPCFVCCGLAVPFADVACEEASLFEYDESDVDELFWCLWDLGCVGGVGVSVDVVVNYVYGFGGVECGLE